MSALPKYAASLQKALAAFSSDYIPLSIRTGMMDSKTQFKATLVEFQTHAQTKSKKEGKLNEVLTMYHSAVSTKQKSLELFELLSKTHEECNRTLLSDYDLETIGGSGYDADNIKRNQLARRTVVVLLSEIIDKVKIQLLDTIQDRLPLTEDELEKLVTYLTGAAQVSSLWMLGQKYNVFSRTPNLEKSYGEWLPSHKNDPLMAIDPSKQKLIPTPSFASSSSDEDGSFKELDRALKILNMTYVDPETNVTYGAARAVQFLEVDPMERYGKSMEREEDRSADLDSKEARGTASLAITVTSEEPSSTAASVEANSTSVSEPASRPQPPQGPVPVINLVVVETATTDVPVQQRTGTDDASATTVPTRPTRGPLLSKHTVVLPNSSSSAAGKTTGKGGNGDQKKTD